jgi:V8-like Glu-specific endopeptidase
VAVDVQALTGLREGLARLYPTIDRSMRIVEQSGLDTIDIGFDSNARTNWFKILDEARKHDGSIDAIVDEALKEYPTNQALQLWKAKRTAVPVLEGPPPAAWRGPGDRGGLEKLMEPVSSLVPISYLEVGLTKARSVGKVLRADGESGTGFLIANDLLLTNNHVLPEAASASGAAVLFNYQAAADGLPLEADRRELLPDDFFRTSEPDDWSAVKVAGGPNATWGALDLKPQTVEAGDRVNIIQHPNGELKQISFFSNVVAYVGGGVIQYLTDTEPGSSGSPVFDRRWNVVALHHSGGWISEPGSPDPTKEYYRNEGVLIDRVIAGLS